MALVVGYGTLEDRDGTVGGRDDGCYPFRGAAGCRPSFTGPRKLIGLGSLGVSALQGGSVEFRLCVGALLHFPIRLTAKQELLWTRGIRLVN